MCSIKPIAAFLDLSTRKKRRKAIGLVIDILENIRVAEEQCMARMPYNLQGGKAFAAADYSIDIIIEAIAGLSDAY